MMVVAVILVIVVGGLAFLLRSSGRPEDTIDTSPRVEPGAPDDDDDDLDDADPDAAVPITVEGVAFIHDTHGLRLVRLIEPESSPPEWIQAAMDTSSLAYATLRRLSFPAGGAPGDRKPGTPIEVGDFTGARITPGVAGEYAWRVETLGRDGDFGFFPFATRAGADAALELLEHYHIIRRPLDDDGQPIPASTEDFEEARSRYEETERALAIDVDDEEPPREGPWVSDRR